MSRRLSHSSGNLCCTDRNQNQREAQCWETNAHVSLRTVHAHRADHKYAHINQHHGVSSCGASASVGVDDARTVETTTEGSASVGVADEARTVETMIGTTGDVERDRLLDRDRLPDLPPRAAMSPRACVTLRTAVSPRAAMSPRACVTLRATMSPRTAVSPCAAVSPRMCVTLCTAVSLRAAMSPCTPRVMSRSCCARVWARSVAKKAFTEPGPLFLNGERGATLCCSARGSLTNRVDFSRRGVFDWCSSHRHELERSLNAPPRAEVPPPQRRVTASSSAGQSSAQHTDPALTHSAREVVRDFMRVSHEGPTLKVIQLVGDAGRVVGTWAQVRAAVIELWALAPPKSVVGTWAPRCERRSLTLAEGRAVDLLRFLSPLASLASLSQLTMRALGANRRALARPTKCVSPTNRVVTRLDFLAPR